MHLEDLRAWHWMIVGLIAGLLFAATHRAAGPWFDSDKLTTLEEGDLEWAIAGRVDYGPTRRLILQYRHDQPLIKDLVVHPPVPSDPTHSNWVTGKVYDIVMRSPSGDAHAPPAYYEQWEPFRCRAAIPFKAFSGAPGKYPSVVQYLAAVKKKDSNLSYKYAWWEQPTVAMLLPTAGGFLIIGLAWPLTIMLLQGTGIARPRRARLPRRATSAAAPAARDTSAGDRQLAALNDQLESSLAASATSHDPAASAAVDPTVKPLGAPEPVNAAATAAEEAAKEYGGEFYPVAKPHTHQSH